MTQTQQIDLQTPAPPRRRRFSFLRVLGKTFIATGVLILLFLGYQLFGTNFITESNQKALATEFDRQLETPAPEAPSESPPPPDLGDGIARIEIPKIDVNWVVVEGVSVEVLKKGPGHVPGMALPGEKGNVVISGHRTTYGAPFYRLDEVGVGDLIRLRTARGVFDYEVTETKVVLPTDLSVVVPSDDARVTLTTCTPRFSAAKRLIVVGKLLGNGEASRAA